MTENTQGNPDTEVATDDNPSTNAAEEAVFGSSDNFFGELESQVNGAIADTDFTPTEATPPNNAGPEQVTQQESQEGSIKVDWDSEDNPYKKRYSDSSREAVRLQDDIKDLKPFVPVLEAMKNDSGLVEHVRDYLVGGGRPTKSVKEQLKLDEDFVFDSNDAVSNPDSDSAKVFNAQVDQIVQSRVGQVLQREKTQAAKLQQQAHLKQQESDFKKTNKMTDEQYNSMVEKAKSHVLTLDDIHYLLNRDKVKDNVARSTKADMASQMKNVRNIPTSASGANSQGNNQANPEDSLFDTLLGSDGELDNLFG